MPTGYTAGVHDGSETTLRQFALRCARGIGALIMMRDAPADAPIPQQFEPDTAYYDKQIETVKARIAELWAMTAEDKKAGAAAYNAECEERNRRYVEENDAVRQRYDDMIAKVEAWQGAPAGLKELMRQQLLTARDFDVSDEPLRFASKPKDAATWFADELAATARSLAYATEQRDAEIQRTAERNAWLAQLHAALEGQE